MKKAVAEICNLLLKFSQLRKNWQPSFRSKWCGFCRYTHLATMHIYFHLKNLYLKRLRKKKKPNKFILSCKTKQNFRHDEPDSSTAAEALLKEGNQILETVSVINIFTSHSNENENTSPPKYILWQQITDIYYHLLHIILLYYLALWTSDLNAFNRSVTEMESRNQDSSDSCQHCRMGMKEKEEPTKRCVRLQRKEVY